MCSAMQINPETLRGARIEACPAPKECLSPPVTTVVLECLIPHRLRGFRVRCAAEVAVVVNRQRGMLRRAAQNSLHLRRDPLDVPEQDGFP